MTTIFWFRQDLRLADNPGLFEAAQEGTVMPIYILDEQSAGEFHMGAASQWWLHHSLKALNHSLNNMLNIYKGRALDILLDVIKNNDIEAVYWNRCYEPWRIKADSEIKAILKAHNIHVQSFNGSLLFEPWEILKPDATPYKVYTPYYRKVCLESNNIRPTVPKLENLVLKKDTQHTLTIDDLRLLPKINWYAQIEKQWTVNENTAHEKLEEFLDTHIQYYQESRDYPSKNSTSGLSPYLHFGQISPNQIWEAIQHQELFSANETGIEHFKKELIWREFSYYWLYYFPDLPYKNFEKKFDKFPWKTDSTLLRQWQQGQTGYPLVDAGMRELWQTGYMHNRVRMVVASFLVKNLKIHWREGAKWFWDCLLDADLANNSASWQWVAGSGLDAAPYFRIFNPTTQGEKFDPEGEYVRKFVPELAKLPNKYLFKPSEAREHILKQANVVLGKTYPHPIIDLKKSREEALIGYNQIK